MAEIREIKIIGIDIGGTKCSVSLGFFYKDRRGLHARISDKEIFPTNECGSALITLKKIKDTIFALISRNGISDIKDISGTGISCGGPLDTKKGVIMSPPNLPGWDNVEIVKYFEKETGISAVLQNDANACAIAEWKFGIARGKNNVVFLTFGTGMGAGLIIDGRLYSGTAGMAGEAGHIRLAERGPCGYGKKGSFEGFCSGGGIKQMAEILTGNILRKGGKLPAFSNESDPFNFDARTLADSAEKGDSHALSIYRKSGKYLGRGLAVIIDILNPEIIVIGSIFARSEGLLRKTMMKTLEKECLSTSLLSCLITAPGLGENIGDYGAMASALYGKGMLR
ncbi:MAG: ROK family protein [Eubacteriales bacterium]|nr:ROK family protein [Eubacteriales bacterium]